MPYLYAKNESNPPTVDEMWSDYKIAKIHLSVREFIDLYPEVSNEDLLQLEKKFDAWVEELKTNKE